VNIIGERDGLKLDETTHWLKAQTVRHHSGSGRNIWFCEEFETAIGASSNGPHTAKCC